MRTRRVLGPIWVSMMIFALPAGAQTPDGVTPAEEGICNTADFANATPGLQGLCVAMCEAQDCEATMEEVVLADGTVETTVKFSPSCNNSAKQILANYDKLANYDPEKGPVDPPMPCVQVACPCWAADEIMSIADKQDGNGKYASTCIGGPDWAYLSGPDKKGGIEFTYTVEEDYIYTNGNMVTGSACSSMEQNPFDSNSKGPIGSAAYATCYRSVVQECSRRGTPIPTE